MGHDLRSNSVAPSKSQVDKAGNVVRDWWGGDGLAPADLQAALLVLWQYRAGFSRPMTKVSANLRYYVKRSGATEVLVAQRLKRLPRMVQKVHRLGRMRMSQMQDVGGCRAIPQEESGMAEAESPSNIIAKRASYWT